MKNTWLVKEPNQNANLEAVDPTCLAMVNDDYLPSLSFPALYEEGLLPKYTRQRITLKSWAEEDRPREKLMHRGKEHLSDSELLAVLLRTGSHEETAVGLAQLLLNAMDNNLHTLGK
ncbi:MAG: UPF0758 domain-containing protein, partial [Bacteroidota bacterium]